jgi:GT2 family glycosyltransferase
MNFTSRPLRVAFELRPEGDLAHRGDGQWVATGSDPRFRVVSPNGSYPGGRVLLETSLLREANDSPAKLYYDSGRGFTGQSFVVVPVASSSRSVTAVIELPARVRALRWDPAESPGVFTQGPLYLTALDAEALSAPFAARLGSALRGVLPRFRVRPAGPAAVPAARESAPPPAVRFVRPNAERVIDAQPQPAAYEFFLDRFSDQEIAGWVVDKAAPHTPVEVDLYLNGELVQTKPADEERTDVAASGKGGPRCGFWFAVPQRMRAAGAVAAKLCRAGSRNSFDGQVYVFTAPEVLLRGVLTACEALRQVGPGGGRLSASLPASEASIAALRHVVLPGVLGELRRNWAQRPQVLALPEEAQPDSDVVDVIVPAYRGFEETVACIESVMNAKVASPFELVVVNDCSPEPQLTAELQRLAVRYGFRLLENAENLGFVRSVNRGMMLHENRDVILLNSDAVVAEGWLDRMRRAAYRDGNIATVTPFSNRATICSFPLGDRDCDLPKDVPLAELARLCARANDGASVDLPTAVGFCMYVRRAALREAGYFDEVRWGKGYAEENDFCLRAADLGWRHVLACDVFVEHHGAVSFVGEKQGRVQENLARLGEIYPDYAATVARFIQADPIAPARRRLFAELARARAGRFMLQVLHAWGGGAEAAAKDLGAGLASQGEGVLYLTASAPERLALSLEGSNLALEYKGPDAYAAVTEDLRRLHVWHVHVHQLVGHGAQAYRIAESLGVRYDVTLHDYYFVCPRINLMDESERYCGEPAAEQCNRCVEASGTHEWCTSLYASLGSDVARWRAQHARFLAGARRVISPSRDVERRTLGYFPLKNMLLRPHPEPLREVRPRAAAADGLVVVAVIGAIGVHKGFEVLKSCAQDAHRRDLPLRFVVVGYTCDDEQVTRFGNVIVTGRYERERLGELLRQHACSVAAFFSVWPETFSYTLSEAWSAGLLPVTLDIGAQAERVRETGLGVVLPFPSEPAQINDALVRAARAPRADEARTIGAEYAHYLTDYYDLADAPGANPVVAVAAGQ